MADLQRPSLAERDLEQAITALKRGAHLLKYGRRGKPKFCPFRLSIDESTLIWYYGKDEKTLELCNVSRIIPGQRTAIFQRYPRPDKEYQSFSLLYNERSLDLICKDKDEAEVWFAGLKALIARSSNRKSRNGARSEISSSDSPRGRRVAPSLDLNENQIPENASQSRLGKAFADIVSYTAAAKKFHLTESATNFTTPHSVLTADNSNFRTSGADTFRVSLSSAVSSSSQGSCNDDIDSMGDVFIWGEGTGDGFLGGGNAKFDRFSSTKVNTSVPKPLQSTMVLDVKNIACGQRHAVLITKQGETFSWGEEAGGRLGHGVEANVSHPELIKDLSAKKIELVACGEYHTCAASSSGDVYTWGDGQQSNGLLGHGNDTSHWIPKRLGGVLEGLHVMFISCGPWHSALLTSSGKLFTFGDGTFGALGHADRKSAIIPREVETLKGLRTMRVACGVWHTAAIVEVAPRSSNSEKSDQFLPRRLFTWGDGDKGRLGHGNNESRLLPERVPSLAEVNFSRVACGDNFTLGLTTSGRVYGMGRIPYGQAEKASPLYAGKTPICIKENITESYVEEIACGSQHVVVLTSKAEIYTWGKGSKGQLGHGDNEDRNTPALVEFFKGKQVKSIACGSNFTAVVCIHKWISGADNSICSGCRNPFTFLRKRRNCYNCGLVFCKACTTKKSLKASLAPCMNKPYRVCDSCFHKLSKDMDSSPGPRVPRVKTLDMLDKASEFITRESGGSRLPGFVSRLSSVDSFKSDRSSSAFNMTSESNDNHIFLFRNGNVQRSSTSSKSPTSPFESSKNYVSFSVPSSRIVSRSPSPVPGTSNSVRSATQSPPQSFRASEAASEDIKCSNDSLSQEVKRLRAQAEELSGKSQFLESQVERLSNQLQEMTIRAEQEAGKNKAAEEVIKSLTSRIREMAERTQEDQIACRNSDANEQAGGETNRPSNGSSVTSTTSPKTEQVDNSTLPSLSNGSKVHEDHKTERIVQDEPGVYITLIPLSNGINELRRVRFSRKRFTEQQAEKWWTENETRVCQQHNIQAVQ